MAKNNKSKATIQVNNGPVMDLDEVQAGGAAFDGFSAQMAAILKLDERARETGIEFRASLDRVSQDAEGERKIVFKVPRSDTHAIDVVSHWTELPLKIQVFVEKRWVQDALPTNGSGADEGDEDE